VLTSLRRDGRLVHPVGWLSDGRLLAAAFDHVNEHAILVDPVTGASQGLPGTYARISGVKRDGSAMLVLTRDGGAASVSLAGGQVTPLVAPRGAKDLVESVAWSPGLLTVEGVDHPNDVSTPIEVHGDQVDRVPAVALARACARE
jgi:hypothetical protein